MLILPKFSDLNRPLDLLIALYAFSSNDTMPNLSIGKYKSICGEFNADDPRLHIRTECNTHNCYTIAPFVATQFDLTKKTCLRTWIKNTSNIHDTTQSACSLELLISHGTIFFSQQNNINRLISRTGRIFWICLGTSQIARVTIDIDIFHSFRKNRTCLPNVLPKVFSFT